MAPKREKSARHDDFSETHEAAGTSRSMPPKSENSFKTLLELLVQPVAFRICQFVTAPLCSEKSPVFCE